MKYTSKWYDKLLLFSPATWFGALDMMQNSPFTKANPRKLLRSVISLLVPILVFRLLDDAKKNRQLLIFSVGNAVHQLATILPQTYLITLAFYTYIKFRQPALPEALDCLHQRIESGRCHHYGRFDVFLPKFNDDSSTEAIIDGLILLPGALISHVAYSQVASRLSDLGICVVVVSMEPLRMATSKLGSSRRRLAKIRRKVQQRSLLGKTVNWSIGGHSLGSFAAMKLIEEDRQYQKLVLWATNNKTPSPYLLKLQNTSHPVLLVQGSNDPFCYMDGEALHLFLQLFPPGTSYHIIEGASHMWFASTQQGDPVSMGRASISMAEQQERVAALTAEFL